MKSSQVTLIVVGFILLALMATNPSIEDHRQAVIEKMKEKIEESSNSESKNEWQKAGEAIGMAIGQGFVLGNIFTSRGGLFNSLENGYKGMVYVPLKEWECSTYPQ
jgi:hypothetical protein